MLPYKKWFKKAKKLKYLDLAIVVAAAKESVNQTAIDGRGGRHLHCHFPSEKMDVIPCMMASVAPNWEAR